METLKDSFISKQKVLKKKLNKLLAFGLGSAPVAFSQCQKKKFHIKLISPTRQSSLSVGHKSPRESTIDMRPTAIISPGLIQS